jgi:hypothetical protein
MDAPDAASALSAAGALSWCWSGRFSLEDGLKLVPLRTHLASLHQLMQASSFCDWPSTFLCPCLTSATYVASG